MAPIPAVTYTNLRDYTALPAIRKICSSGTTEFRVTALPIYDGSALLEELSRLGREDLRIFKKQITDANPPLPTGIIKMITALHGLSAYIFNNISHVLELPWENYLNEMHEFEAESDDELRVFKDTDVERKWASLVPNQILVLDPSNVQECLVVFGEALRVFSENAVAVDTSSAIKLHQTSESQNDIKTSGVGSGEKVAYYVRPNADVFYTRGAGALMTPLSDREYAERQRVKDITFQF